MINQSINQFDGIMRPLRSHYLSNKLTRLVRNKELSDFFFILFFQIFLTRKITWKTLKFRLTPFSDQYALYIYFYFMIILCFYIFSFICLYGQFINVDKFYYSKLRR